jgi:putative addiction module component (TIGR02574 family)
MNDRVKQLFDQAQQLSPEEQAQLLDMLLTKNFTQDVTWDSAWAEEAERRWRAYKSGETKTYSWDEVKNQLRRA